MLFSSLNFPLPYRKVVVTYASARRQKAEGKKGLYFLPLAVLLPLFCHSPVFRIMSSFQRQGMLSDAAFNDDILTNLALSSISTQKKAGDRLICKSSSI